MVYCAKEGGKISLSMAALERTAREEPCLSCAHRDACKHEEHRIATAQADDLLDDWADILGDPAAARD